MPKQPNPDRLAKLRRLLEQRQPDMTIILENVWDPHNLSAVLRTADAVGMMEVYALYTEPFPRSRLRLGKKSSAGTRKWVDVKMFENAEDCFSEVRKRYQSIYGLALHENSEAIYQADFTKSFALVFGNEQNGLSPEVKKACDALLHIPMVGMAESLNISVACAVTAFEAMRQRSANGQYNQANFSAEQLEVLVEDYIERGRNRKGEILAEKYSEGN
jgi:tRNA (guanosine-2'-O-)-methyltransferase